MSHKQAKKLRKQLRESDLFTKGEVTRYQDESVKTVLVPSGKVDEKGNAIMIPQVRVQRSCVGQRKVYQQLKRGV